MRTKPRATSAYMTPFSSPLMVSSMAKSRSGMRDVFQAHHARNLGGAPVLVGDGHAHGHVTRGDVVERIDDVPVAIVDETASQLAGARDLGVVGVQLLVEERETTHPLGG